MPTSISYKHPVELAADKCIAQPEALTLYSMPPLDAAPNHPLLARPAGFSLHAAARV